LLFFDCSVVCCSVGVRICCVASPPGAEEPSLRAAPHSSTPVRPPHTPHSTRTACCHHTRRSLHPRHRVNVRRHHHHLIAAARSRARCCSFLALHGAASSPSSGGGKALTARHCLEKLMTG
jgi:hypothetical protein